MPCELQGISITQATWFPGMLRYAQRRVALARAETGSPEDSTGETDWRLVRNAETFTVTLPETNKSHLKMEGWKTSFLLG